jgi:hypothetical protein
MVQSEYLAVYALLEQVSGQITRPPSGKYSGGQTCDVPLRIYRWGGPAGPVLRELDEIVRAILSDQLFVEGSDHGQQS